MKPTGLGRVIGLTLFCLFGLPMAVPSCSGRNHADSQLIRGHIILFDGFQDADQSGLQFSTQSVVSFFSGKADLTVLNTNPPGDVALLFIQANVSPYKNAPQDKGAHGGIRKMQQPGLDDVKECPLVGYSHHWFSVEVNGVYCVQARDGHHFAKVQVMSLEQDRIALDWVYQPANSRKF